MAVIGHFESDKDQVAKLSDLVANLYNIQLGFKALREGFPQVACVMVAAVMADPLFQSFKSADIEAAKE